MSRMLITGGSGFVGAVLVNRARAGGWRLVVAGRRGAGDGDSGFEHVRVGDMGPETDWRAALRGVDVVVHLAARAHVLTDSEADPLMAFRRVNVAGSAALARQAFMEGVRRFVYVSSAGVFGATSGGRPFLDTDYPSPHSAYTQSKLEAERALLALGEQTGRSVVCVRPPLVYGPDAPGNLRRLIGLVAAGWPLPLGAVQNRRSLIGVDNLADFLLCVAGSDAGSGRSFLVTDGDVSTPELVATIAAGLGVHAKMLPVPVSCLKIGAKVLGRTQLFNQLCGSLQFDSMNARSVFDWQPAVSQQQGLFECGKSHRSLVRG